MRFLVTWEIGRRRAPRPVGSTGHEGDVPAARAGMAGTGHARSRRDAADGRKPGRLPLDELYGPERALIGDQL